MNKTFYENLVDSIINTFSEESVSVYSYSTSDTDLYRQARNYYTGPTLVKCVYMRHPDVDQASPIGRVNEDTALFTFSVLELRRKFPLSSEENWITLKDILLIDNTRYTVVKLNNNGRQHNGSNVVEIVAREYPDDIEVL